MSSDIWFDFIEVDICSDLFVIVNLHQILHFPYILCMTTKQTFSYCAIISHNIK